MNNIDFSKYADLISQMAVEFGGKIAAGLAILILGFWIVGMIMGVIRRRLESQDLSPSLKPFILGMTKMLLRVLVVISALGALGIEMTSFVAILGSVGFAIGLALSGTLQNFAGGVMILFFKPYKVGDWIEAQGYSGAVNEIGIFNTVLTTGDNKAIIIPNENMWKGSLVNYSRMGTRRVDWVFGIAYGDDYDHAKATLQRYLDEDPRIKKDPETFIGLVELADSSVNIAVRGWVDGADYWGVFFDMNEKVYKNFDKEGLSIPYPQMDVHVHKSATAADA
ncbi:mechanosensitive ion channel [bacterium SCSIO 12741]|nr:mechanosensitive ion channel [bacterium SCSIO 12741]